jgi:hypothetical protein
MNRINVIGVEMNPPYPHWTLLREREARGGKIFAPLSKGGRGDSALEGIIGCMR